MRQPSGIQCDLLGTLDLAVAFSCVQPFWVWIFDPFPPIDMCRAVVAVASAVMLCSCVAVVHLHVRLDAHLNGVIGYDTHIVGTSVDILGN